jgi:hypothetical protein
MWARWVSDPRPIDYESTPTERCAHQRKRRSQLSETPTVICSLRFGGRASDLAGRLPYEGEWAIVNTAQASTGMQVIWRCPWTKGSDLAESFRTLARGRTRRLFCVRRCVVEGQAMADRDEPRGSDAHVAS